MLKKFKESDILYSKIKTYPQCNFFIYNGQIYYNEKDATTGSHSANVFPTVGKINLEELNIDRRSDNYIYPYITKDGTLSAFKTISSTDFHSNFTYGDTLTGSYNREAGITITEYTGGTSKALTSGSQINALKNTLNSYVRLSSHYAYSSSFHGDKDLQHMTAIDIPSIFFGSSINKGSVKIQFHRSGVLISQLEDKNRNGELVQMLPAGGVGSGSIAGVVLYDQGMVLLTGSWGLESTGYSWSTFGSISNASSSLNLIFEGTQYIPTITMLCHADKGEMNSSNNPTYIKYGQSSSMTPISSSAIYKENSSIEIKNVVKSPWEDPTGSFERITMISSAGIYDENQNLIAIVKLSRPIRKKQEDAYTIKCKIDF